MKKILLVEDSKTVSKLLSDMLTTRGFPVLVCHSVDEAIATFKETELSVKLVITDLIMPERDGMDLIDHLHTYTPRPKILAISGGSKGTVTADTAVQSVRNKVDGVLVKSFKPEELINTVKSLDA